MTAYDKVATGDVNSVEKGSGARRNSGKRALNRMKEWVTAEYIGIRRMRTDGFAILDIPEKPTRCNYFWS